MKKITDKKYFIIGIVLGIFIIAIILTCVFAMKNNSKQADNWVLRSYDNTVVLLNNDDVVEIFDQIVLDTLPSEDLKHLQSGIPFSSYDEAMSAVEDYDG